MRLAGLDLSRRHALVVVLVVAGSVATGAWFVRPLFHSAWYENHDMVSYPVRAIEYVVGWREGSWWPRWAPDLYGGFGCPFFNFYAPGLFIASGALMLTGLTATTALKVALVLFTALAATAMIGAVHGETRRYDAAAVAAVAFVFMGYHLTQVYVRGDLAEYCAICLSPAVVWAYRALGRVDSRRLPALGVIAALAHAATLLVHTITGQWLTEFVFVIDAVMVWRCWRHRERPRALAIALTFVCACGLTAIYSIPALLDRPEVHIDRMTVGSLATTRNMIRVGWLFERGFFYVGEALMLLPVVAAAAMVRRRAFVPRVAGWTLLAFVPILTMPAIAAPLWAWLPFGAYIQFPWRLLGFVSLFGAIALGASWAELIPARLALAWPLAVIACAGIAVDGWHSLPRIVPLTEAQVPQSATQIAHGIYSTVISDEYVPRVVVVKPSNPQPQYVLAASNVRVESALRSGTGYRLEVSADGPGSVDLRAFWFPGWKVRSRGSATEPTVGPSPLGYLRLHLPERGHYYALVYFGTTALRAAATTASLLSLLVLVLGLRRLRRAASSTAGTAP